MVREFGVVERGRVSSIEGDKARITVPGRMDAVTGALVIGDGARDVNGVSPAVGALVAFVEFADGTGAVFARLE